MSSAPARPDALHHLVVEVTAACHHKCLHCYNHWPQRPAKAVGPGVLTRAEIRHLIRRIRAEIPLERVAISGGEPFLRPDLSGIVRDLTDDGLGVVVISNGTLATPRRLADFPRETLFETTLFSPDRGLHDHIAGREGAFLRTLAGFAAMRQHGCSYVVVVVISSLNAGEVGRTVELGLALGAGGIMLNRVNAGRRLWAEAPGLMPTAEQLRVAFEQAERVAQRYGLRFAASVPVPPCLLDLSAYPHVEFGFCPRGGPEAYYTVAPDGCLRPCNHTSYVLGDLRTQSFAEILRSERTRRYWAPLPTACRSCALPRAAECGGGCTAAARECFGDPRLPDPLVVLYGRGGAREAGSVA